MNSLASDIERAHDPASIVQFSYPHVGLSYERSVPVAGPQPPPTFTPPSIEWSNIFDGRVASIERLTGYKWQLTCN